MPRPKRGRRSEFWPLVNPFDRDYFENGKFHEGSFPKMLASGQLSRRAKYFAVF